MSWPEKLVICKMRRRGIFLLHPWYLKTGVGLYSLEVPPQGNWTLSRGLTWYPCSPHSSQMRTTRPYYSVGPGGKDYLAGKGPWLVKPVGRFHNHYHFWEEFPTAAFFIFHTEIVAGANQNSLWDASKIISQRQLSPPGLTPEIDLQISLYVRPSSAVPLFL